MKLNIGVVTEGGLSKKNMTGTWRVFLPVVDTEQCNGCGICEVFCPDSCVEVNETFKVNENYCKGCGICAYECPKSALTMLNSGGAAS